MHRPGRILPRTAFIRSKDDNDAAVRITSLALVEGLGKLGIESKTLRLSDVNLNLDFYDLIVFHYNDHEAIKYIRANKTTNSLKICLGSDIYSFKYYTDLQDITDYFVMPTDLHKMVLSSALSKPVYVMPECVDAMAITPDESVENLTGFRGRSQRRVCWFGYSESFAKGMSSIIPVINRAMSERKIDSFSLILDQKNFINKFNFPTIEFHYREFQKTSLAFDYAILSHFPLDLRVNSLIKSPNKAITSFCANMIPIASRTPSYENLFDQLNVSDFLFSSPAELDRKLSALDPVADSHRLAQQQVRQTLGRIFSPKAIAARFINIYGEYQASGGRSAVLPPIGGVENDSRDLYFSDHLKALYPTAKSALQSRMRKIFHNYKSGQV